MRGALWFGMQGEREKESEREWLQTMAGAFFDIDESIYILKE